MNSQKSNNAASQPEEDVIEIEQFPFFVGARDIEKDYKLPSYLPLRVYVDKKLALPRVRYTPEVREAVNEAYEIGSMLSTPLGRGQLGAERMDDFLSALQMACGTIKGKRFVEIGSGDGSLMNAIKTLGGEVIGFEIGPQAAEARDRYGLEVYSTPLEPNSILEPVDCIYSYGVLEHISDLQSLFAACRSILIEGGLFFHSVPNTDTTFATERLDDLSHQHVNYFTAQNGMRLFNSQGFRNSKNRPNDAGNELYLWGNFSASSVISWPGDDPSAIDRECAQLSTFAQGIDRRRERWRESFKKLSSKNGIIGFYAGGFAFLDLIPNGARVRFFDGDEIKYGKCWLDGLSPIEDPKTLRDNPVDDLVICPDHHFDVIEDFLKNQISVPDTMQIHSLSEL